MLKKLKRFMSVKYLILLLVFAGIAIAVVELSDIYRKYLWQKNTRELSEAKLKGEVYAIQKELNAIEQIPQNLAYVLEFSNPSKEEMWILLNAIVKNNDEIFGTCIAFEPNKYYKDSTYYAPYIFMRNGNIVSVNPSDTTYHYFSMDWYNIPKLLQKPVWIEPYFDEGSSGGNIVLSTYSVPFYSYNGIKETMTGIIAVDISIEWLTKIVASIKPFDNCYSILVSENGTIISAPETKWAYNESLFSIADENNIPALRQIGRNLQKGVQGFTNVGKFGQFENCWIYYMQIPSNKWGVLLVVPENNF